MPEDHFDERVRPSGARQGLISHHYWIEDGKVDVISRRHSATCGRRSST
jgi:hypothetical protein